MGTQMTQITRIITDFDSKNGFLTEGGKRQTKLIV